MADLSITAANVIAGANAVIDFSHNAGEAITQGQPVYLAAATSKWMKADSNSGTAEAQTAKGVALCAAASGQPLAVHKEGDLAMGAIFTAGESYYLSETPGGIQPYADLGTGENICLLGVARTTSVIAVKIQTPGVTHA